MNILRRAVTGRVTQKFLSTVGDRQFRVVASDGVEDRVGDVLDPYGCQLREFKRNPIMLAQHASDQPIGTWPSIEVRDGRLEALGEFAPEGVSELADEYCRLVKSGVLKAVSVGFLPIEYEPRRGGGYLFKKWDLLELSVVSVGANQNALVIARSGLSSSSNSSGLADRLATIARLRGGLDGLDGPDELDDSHSIPPPNTLSFGGTLEARKWQVRHANRHAESDLRRTLASADSSTLEGRLSIVAAYRRYHERTVR
jgi:HK97 family phage prohead protease